MQELKMGVPSAEEETQAVMKVYSKEDYSVVNRFESEWTVRENILSNKTSCCCYLLWPQSMEDVVKT